MLDWLITIIPYLVALVFFVIGAGCVLLVVLQLPGTWILLAIALIIEMTDAYRPASDEVTFGWWVLGIGLLLALIGEIIEFLAGVVGAKKGGASRAGVVGSILGGLVGAILFTFVPIPIIGTIIGAVLGTFVGAVMGEMHYAKRDLKGSMKPAIGASIGRVVGTMSKVPIAVVVWLMLTVAAII